MEVSEELSSILAQRGRLPDDTVFFSVFPDFSISSTSVTSQLQSLHLHILQTISPYTSDYFWQHDLFTLSVSTSTPCFCSFNPFIPHLHGKLRFGDNVEDEWFVVFLLFEISRRFPDLSVRVWDSDGEFLLIEAAFHLPRWLNPDTSPNRVFIRRGQLHIVPTSVFPATPTIQDSLTSIIESPYKSVASDSVQSAINNRIGDYPERARRNMHRVRVRVPISVAQVLKYEPCLISLAVVGFYDRDIDSMKFAAKMVKFLPKGNNEDIVQVSMRMSRAMYAQLVQQTFQAPKCYPMPPRSDMGAYVEAELGMKITCGFEMVYQSRKIEGGEGKGTTWETFKESLEKSGYFRGLLPGSKEYKRLMENAEEYYKTSSLHSRASELLSAPVRRIDEILSQSYSAVDFKGQEVPPSDDDSWLYSGEDELNAALQDRQNEMELYNLKHKRKQKLEEQQDAGPSSNLGDFNLGDIAKSMQAFVDKMSSYKGAEVPQERNLKDVDLDVDCFMKDMESVLGRQCSEDADSDVNIDEDLSSDMDFDESEGESDIAEPSENNKDTANAFMHSYSDVLKEELKGTTIGQSFVRANEQTMKEDEGTSNATGDVDEDLTPVDVDMNLVKSFLDSFSSQQGLPGPASNLLGLMGLNLPKDSHKEN